MAPHGLPPSELATMTPAETRVVGEILGERLKAQADERLAIVKLLATAASAGRVRL